jgi:hypothetical protein
MMTTIVKKIYTVIAFCVTLSSLGCSTNRDRWKDSHEARHYGYSNVTNSGSYSNRPNSGGDFVATNSDGYHSQGHSYRTYRVPGPLPIVGLIGMCYFAYKLKNRNGNR